MATTRIHYGAEYWVLQQANNGIGHQPEFDFNGNYTRQNYLNAGGTGVGSTHGFVPAGPALGRRGAITTRRRSIRSTTRPVSSRTIGASIAG